MVPAAGAPDDRWAKVKDIVGAVLAEPPESRAGLVDELCGGDADLRGEVESLLQADAAAPSFFDRPLTLAAPDEGGVDPNIGRMLGPYVVDRAIGHGGMGTVYIAHRADEEFERRVAIKMIRRGMDFDVVIRRFRHERQILATLDHPNIAALFDGGTSPDGLPYFVMEYVAGTPIDVYAREHELSTAAKIELCLPVLDAVQHAHDRHVVHRDIKPANVMVTPDGRPKLLDFGIAKILAPDDEDSKTLTSLGRAMTPEYASPEQLRGEPVTPATDVYALGLLLYELLTGSRPYASATTPDERAELVAAQEPERPSTVATRAATSPALPQSLTGAIDEIVLKALRREPDQRYASVAALAADLRTFLDQRPVGIAWDARQYRIRRFARRHRRTAAAVVAIAAVTAAGVLIGARATRRAAPVATSVAARKPSLAVIGFRNLSGRATDGWLATAMTEMLTTDLGGDGQIRVVPGERVSRVERELDREGTLASADMIQQIRTALTSDYAVVGTIAVNDGGSPRSVRIDVRVLHADDEPISVAATGDEQQLFAVVGDVSRAVRSRLGLPESPPEVIKSVHATFPQSVEATRLYAEGMARLRVLDAVGARTLLEQAAAREPESATIQIALASAWSALGYDNRAAEAAQKALQASGGLNREERLNVEGRVYEVQRKWTNAVDVYRSLWGFDPENVEYGLRLAAAQRSAGQGKTALDTVAALHRLRGPESQDPRIDLEEAQAWEALGDYTHEAGTLERASQRVQRSGSRLLVARTHLLEGRAYFNLGQVARAERALDDAQQIFLEVGDRAAAASALDSLAVVLSDQQDISRAEQMHRQAFAVSEEIGDRRGMSSSLNNLGILLKDQRRFDDARRAHERALALRREIADQNLIATSLSNIGVVLFEQDRLRQAADYYRQALAISRAIGDRRNQIRALHNLAIVDRELGRDAQARAGYEESLAMRRAIGDKRGMTIGQVELGAVLFEMGELAAARDANTEALSLSREIHFKPSEGEALYQLGDVALAAGRVADARRFHTDALTIRREMNETRTVLASEIALARVALEDDRAPEAEESAERIARQLERESDRIIQVEIATLVARARLAAGDARGADRALAPARPLAAATQQVGPKYELALADAEIDAALGRRDRARTKLTATLRSLATTGLRLLELDVRAALLRLDALARRPTVAADAAALRKDAAARGAGLILKRIAGI